MKDLVATVRKQNLFSPGETIVVAVSGGADSVALLDILSRLDDLNLNLVVAHLNHCLRGADSDGDQEFVAALAARYGLPFAVERVDVAAAAGRKRLSLEDAGRRARYRFFDETAQARGATSIALAHHLDDQAETVLIRLLRGAGAAGLSGMAPARHVLKRPLLLLTRDELERYLKLRGLPHRNDASNADTAFLRNSIRHELIPLLRRYNPKVSHRLAATAEILARDEELLEQLTETAYRRLATDEPGKVTVAAELLMKEPRGLRLRLYRRCLLTLRGDLRHIAQVHLEAADRLLLSERPNARAKLPGDCFVTRCYGSLSFQTAPRGAAPEWELAVSGEGEYRLPDGRTLQVLQSEPPRLLDPGSPLVAYLAPEAAPFPWLLRGFRPGDRFVPLGMEGTQKIKDLFINNKVPPADRSRIPLLVSGGEIVWVAGIRLGDRARVKPAVGAVLRVEILEITP